VYVLDETSPFELPDAPDREEELPPPHAEIPVSAIEATTSTATLLLCNFTVDFLGSPSDARKGASQPGVSAGLLSHPPECDAPHGSKV
jgi:hypothetical protein